MQINFFSWISCALENHSWSGDPPDKSGVAAINRALRLCQDPFQRGEQRKRVALVVLTGAGLELALRIGRELEEAECHVYASTRALSVDLSDPLITRFEQIRPTLAYLWKAYDQLVLCFALGAVIRLIAPLLQDKRVDPGVVAIDDAGQFAISVVAGHLGGAND